MLDSDLSWNPDWLCLRSLTKRLTAGVTRTLTTVLLHGGELLVRLAELPHAAAGREAWRVPPVRLAPSGEPPLQELLLIVLLLHTHKHLAFYLIKKLFSALFYTGTGGTLLPSVPPPLVRGTFGQKDCIKTYFIDYQSEICYIL